MIAIVVFLGTIVLFFGLVVLLMGLLNFLDNSLQSLLGFSNALVLTIGLCIFCFRYRKRRRESLDYRTSLIRISPTDDVDIVEKLNRASKHELYDKLGFSSAALGFGIALVSLSENFIPYYFSTLLIGSLLVSSIYFLFYVPACMSIESYITDYWKSKIAADIKMYRNLMVAIMFASALLGGYLEYLG